ncbi:hypothetical protein G6N05_03580 [Flavobacterium sp. F372]|uniref:TonB C-terminal domain-containing protein n=1 Tax=Flavobacterium bernardetii TaxID=2813823 RepID=A0ABR7IVZ7_9FLAO|nr:hypothetical protein [Flavobacterium bernardetii]MBC5833954.1 hypothetical protein [Flavobacterium bernardetii]NHF69186.1 hypothetical protein [Flavobacterium bernardetii]
MKRLFLILIIVFLFSCGKSKIVNFDNINYLKSGNNLDSLCKVETERAENDIKKGKIVYFHFFGMVAKYDSDLEFNELLLKNNIKVDSALYYCTADELEYCYPNRMYREIENLHGKNFIDSLRNIADKQFITKHPDKIYDYFVCDQNSLYPNDKSYYDFVRRDTVPIFLNNKNYTRYSQNYENDFLKSVEYPNDFVFKKENDTLVSRISAEFTLFKNGNIKNVDIQTYFYNKINEKHSFYYSEKMKEFILKTKWVPARNKDITVNCKVLLLIFLDK